MPRSTDPGAHEIEDVRRAMGVDVRAHSQSLSPNPAGRVEDAAPKDGTTERKASMAGRLKLKAVGTRSWRKVDYLACR